MLGFREGEDGTEEVVVTAAFWIGEVGSEEEGAETLGDEGADVLTSGAKRCGGSCA